MTTMTAILLGLVIFTMILTFLALVLAIQNIKNNDQSYAEIRKDLVFYYKDNSEHNLKLYKDTINQSVKHYKKISKNHKQIIINHNHMQDIINQQNLKIKTLEQKIVRMEQTRIN